MLSADTGVTQSDLAIWREHVGVPAAASAAAWSSSTRSTGSGTN
jgi:hypothetical protein